MIEPDDDTNIDRDGETELDTFADTPLPTEQFEFERAGAVIGRYKLAEKLGEGGFGSVWMAEQEEPIVRKVALKIIKLGMDTKEVIARFEAERQALALMDHPHIAKVLDAGATESGRPFFVMELVEGTPITAFADENKLDTKARLRLFNEVCAAIQHAHQKGIIHRDLKPSNILVTRGDDHPVPKVIDFGIAKATEQSLTERTLQTRVEQIIGTPAYMSPEQASRSTVDIDTRSDIYSLGVLLYELLTGKPPFDAKTLREAGYEEIRRMIREDDPPRPSTRLGSFTDHELDTLTTTHLTTPEKLGRILRGDLDWIVMKAIEKERARRYDSADAFAEDIRRFLRSEPVSAAAPSVSYRLSRYLTRNRTPVTIGSLFALLLIVGSTVSIRQAIRATDAEGRAELRATEQAREADKAKRAVTMMQTIFESADPDRVRDPDYTVNELLDDFTAGVDWEELAQEPEIEIVMRSTIAQAYLNLGRFPEAAAHGEREVELGKSIWGEQSADLADSMARLAYAYRVQNEPEKGEQQYRTSLAIRRAIFGEEHAAVAQSLAGLAAILTDQNKLDEAGPLHEQALEMRKRLLDEDHADITDSLTEYAAYLRARGDLAEAEEIERQALTRTEKEPDVHLRAKGLLLFNLAQTLENQGRLGEAEAKYREVAAMAKEHLGPKNPFRGPPMLGLGRVLQAQNRLEEAEAVLRETLTLGESVPGEEHILVTITRSTLASVLFQRGQTQEAETLFLKSLEIIRKLEGDETPGLDDLINSIAEILRGNQKFDEAGKLHREALALRRKLFGEKHEKTAISLNNVGIVHQDLNELAEAETHYRQAVEILSTLESPAPDVVRVIGSNLIYSLQLQGKDGEIAAAERDLSPLVEKHNQSILKRAGEIAQIVVPPDSNWRWLHPVDGIDPAEKTPDFHQAFFHPDFDDSAWNSGADSPGPKGGFAYGEADFEGVDIGQPAPGNRHCAYFRLKFTTTAELANLELRLRRDDGVIVYLNGREVVRNNVALGPEGYRLAAIDPISWLDENYVHRHPIRGPLAAGEHTLAISVHNRGDGSSDLRVAEITLVALDSD